MAKPTIAELQAQLTEMTARATAAEARVATLTADLASANERADHEAGERQQAESRADTADQEIRELASSLKAYKGSATRARREATILKAELSPEARPIGALRPARSDDETAARAAAIEAAFAMGPTEIVFSDGKREIREVAPLICDGNAWLQRPNDRELNDAPILEMVGERQQAELRGFGLLNSAGEQVAYCALPSPIALERSQKMRIPQGCIRF